MSYTKYNFHLVNYGPNCNGAPLKENKTKCAFLCDSQVASLWVCSFSVKSIPHSLHPMLKEKKLWCYEYTRLKLVKFILVLAGKLTLVNIMQKNDRFFY